MFGVFTEIVIQISIKYFVVISFLLIFLLTRKNQKIWKKVLTKEKKIPVRKTPFNLSGNKIFKILPENRIRQIDLHSLSTKRALPVALIIKF